MLSSDGHVSHVVSTGSPNCTSRSRREKVEQVDEGGVVAELAVAQDGLFEIEGFPLEGDGLEFFRGHVGSSWRTALPAR